jgi:quercetin dioxygenase-like cupin family protein
MNEIHKGDGNMTKLEDFERRQFEMKHFDPERDMAEDLVVSSESAFWLDSTKIGNPCRIGALIDVPARTMDFFLQEIPAGEASDLQRHAHESVHYVIEGHGRSEIGPKVVSWAKGDLVYTPPWVWHRHYNESDVEPVRMLLIENSGLLSHLGLNHRESAGLIAYRDYVTGAAI